MLECKGGKHRKYHSLQMMKENEEIIIREVWRQYITELYGDSKIPKSKNNQGTQDSTKIQMKG